MSPAKVVQGNGGRVGWPGEVGVESVAGECHEELENLKAWNEYTHQKISCWRFRSRIESALMTLNPWLWLSWLPMCHHPRSTGTAVLAACVYWACITFPSVPITWGSGPSLLCFPMSRLLSSIKDLCSKYTTIRRWRKIIKLKKKV